MERNINKLFSIFVRKAVKFYLYKCFLTERYIISHLAKKQITKYIDLFYIKSMRTSEHARQVYLGTKVNFL